MNDLAIVAQGKPSHIRRRALRIKKPHAARGSIARNLEQEAQSRGTGLAIDDRPAARGGSKGSEQRSPRRLSLASVGEVRLVRVRLAAVLGQAINVQLRVTGEAEREGGVDRESERAAKGAGRDAGEANDGVEGVFAAGVLVGEEEGAAGELPGRVVLGDALVA